MKKLCKSIDLACFSKLEADKRTAAMDLTLYAAGLILESPHFESQVNHLNHSGTEKKKPKAKLVSTIIACLQQDAESSISFQQFITQYADAAYYYQGKKTFSAFYCIENKEETRVFLKGICQKLEGVTILVLTAAPQIGDKIVVPVVPKVLTHYQFANRLGYKEWFEPKSLSLDWNQAKMLNLSMVPKQLKSMAEGITWPKSQTLDYVVGGIVSIIGTVLSQFFQVGVSPKDTSRYSPAIWTLLVGDSGCGKTPVLSTLMDCASACIVEQCALETDKKEIHKQIKQQLLRKGINDAVKGDIEQFSFHEYENDIDRRLSSILGGDSAKKYGLHLTTDASLAGMYQLMSLGLPVLYLADETKSFLTELAKKDSSSAKLRSVILNSDSGLGRISVSRANQNTKSIKNGSISVLSAIQPDVLGAHIYEAQKGSDSNDGLLNRFQWLVLNVSNINEHITGSAFNKIIPVDCKQFFDVLNKWRPVVKESVEVVYLSNDAYNAYLNWCSDNSAKLDKLMTNRLLANQHRKYPVLVCKLSCIYQVIMNYDMDYSSITPLKDISLEAFNFAKYTVDYLASHAETVFSPDGVSAYKNARSMLEKLKGLPANTCLSASEMAQRGWQGNKNRSTEQVEESLRLLEKHGFVRPVKQGKKLTWEVNPMAPFID